MSEFDPRLRRFRARARTVLVLRSLALGLLIAGVVAGVLAATWLFSGQKGSWLIVGLALGFGALVGIVRGFLPRLNADDLARSLDLRLNLQDRVTTAIQDDHDSPMSDAQNEDAWQKVAVMTPKQAYPLRPWGLFVGAGCLAIVPLLLVLVADRGLMLKPGERARRETMAKQAAAIRRVAAPPKEAEPGYAKLPEFKAQAAKLNEMARKLEQGSMSESDRMIAADKIMEDAKKLTEERVQRAETLAQTSAESLKQAALDQAMQRMGESDQTISKETQEAAKREMDHNLTPEEAAARDARMQELANSIQQGEKSMESDGLTPQERETLQKNMDKMRSELQQLKLSKEAQKALAKLMQMKEYQDLQKKMQEMMEKLREQQQEGSTQEQQKLTEEQLKQIQEQLDQLAEMMKDEEAVKEMLRQMQEQLGQMNAASAMIQLQMEMGAAMGTSGPQGQGGPGHDKNFMGQGPVSLGPKVKQDLKTQTSAIKGQRQEKGEESTITIKGPARLGDRSVIPYSQALTEYRRRAEAAMNRKAIPKRHEKRVRAYFDSLERGVQK